MRYLSRYIAALFFIVPALLSSCIEENGPVCSNEVKLKASFTPSISISTKGQGVINPDYESNLNIGIARIDEGDTGYPLFTQTSAPQKAVVRPGSADRNLRDITFKNYEQFRDADSYIKYASWYPDSGSYDETGKKISFPVDGNTDIMFGSIATGNQTKGFNTVYFDHSLCKFTFHVYAMVNERFSQEDIQKIWGKIQSISLKGLPEEYVLTLPTEKMDAYGHTYNLTDPENLIFVPKEGGNYDPQDPTNHLLDILPTGLAQAKTLTPLLAAPPEDGLLDIIVKTDVGSTVPQVSTKSMTISRDFQKGKNYDIYLRFSDHGLINVDIAIGEWQRDQEIIQQENITNDIYYDLSSTEKSNCYIITSANYSYCIDISTKGNGVSGAVDATPVTMDPKYINIIWMDECLEDYFFLDNHMPIQKRAMFHITNDQSNGNPKNKDDKSLSANGNVLIGAYDKNPKDGGKLLWTWHIWLTDMPQNQGFKNGFVVLDRDLGARAKNPDNADLSAIDGLYYQWGRPTPLPLSRSAVTPDADIPLTETPIYSPFTMHSSAEAHDLNTRISNPSAFYTDPAQIEQHANYLELWGLDLNTIEYEKTIYDPCPPGYRISSKRLFEHIDDLGYTVKNHALVTPDEKQINPLSGYFSSPENNTEYDKGSYLWSGTVSPQSGNRLPYSLSCSVNDPVNPTGADPGEITEMTPVNALPVRCVSRRSSPETIDLSSFQTANSYVVSKDGFYKFNVGVRGNGINKLIFAGSDENIDITESCNPDISDDIVGVKYLWWQEDLSSTVNPQDAGIPVKFLNDGKVVNDGKKAWVYFVIEENEYRHGNLIVSGENSRGEILWSWHLWLTDQPATHLSNDFAVMDRNLGATYAPGFNSSSLPDGKLRSTYGFFYQWGRKDPFTTETWYKYDRQNDLWTSQAGGIDKTTMFRDPAQKTVAASVSTPLRYHAAQKANLDIDPTSLSVSDEANSPVNQCFSNLREHGAMWGYSATASGFGRTTTKTMYDPCPPGYSVCYYLVWTNADKYNGANIFTNKDSGNINASNMSKRLRNQGIFLNYTGFDKTWYPFTGYIDSDGDHMNENSVGTFQSSTPGGNGGRSIYYLQSRSSVYTGQAVDGNYCGIPSSYALPVRCQKD